MQDTLDEGPKSRDDHVTFSAKRGTINLSSDWNRQRPNHYNQILRGKLYFILHVFQFLLLVAAVTTIMVHLKNLGNKVDDFQTIATKNDEAFEAIEAILGYNLRGGNGNVGSSL